MFYLGLEMASIPMACLVALDKHRNNSAEGAAKYILTAAFSSGVMLFVHLRRRVCSEKSGILIIILRLQFCNYATRYLSICYNGYNR